MFQLTELNTLDDYHSQISELPTPFLPLKLTSTDLACIVFSLKILVGYPESHIDASSLGDTI